MKKWFVYIIRDESNTLYTGVTTDIDRRFAEHVEGGKKAAKYLRSKKNIKLVYSCKVGDKQESYRIEAKIKALLKTEKEEIVRRELGLDHLRDFLS